MALNPQYGVQRDRANSEVSLNYAGTKRLKVNSTGASVTGTLSATGTITSTGALTASSLFNLAASEATVASGVLTVTTPFVNVLPESSTADQVDSIVYTGAVEGTILICVSKATNTITFDDANINLGAATRAVAPGGAIALYYDGSQWTELVFIAATDNV